MGAVRSAEELARVDDPAWPSIQGLLESSTVAVDLLPGQPDRSFDALHRLQVTARSPLGALALNCGGVLVDCGWLRVLGGGSDELPSLAEANGLRPPAEARSAPGKLVVAFDALGGRFAINGGNLAGPVGDVHYFAPDTLRWETIGVSYSEFLAWALSGGLVDFYAGLRWPGWEEEVAALQGWQGISVYPFLFTQQGRDVAAAHRTPVPISELFELFDELSDQVQDLPQGATFNLRIQ